MFEFKKCKKEPVRLHKKEEVSQLEEFFKLVTCMMKDPEFLFVIIFIITFMLVTGFAIHESMAYFVYNTGGL